MNIHELYAAKVEAKDRQFEVLRSDGTPSGHHIVLKPVDSEDVEIAVVKYRRLLAQFDESFKAANAELLAESEAAGDFGEYNIRHGRELVKLQNAVAAELVEGWDFDTEFSQHELSSALAAFKGLGDQIWAAYITQLANYQKK